MPQPNESRQTVIRCLSEFLKSTGRTDVELKDSTRLIRGIGLTSDEGVDFVVDLCDAFVHDFPADFNPFVHDDGLRDRTIGEMVDAVSKFISAAKIPT